MADQLVSRIAANETFSTLVDAMEFATGIMQSGVTVERARTMFRALTPAAREVVASVLNLHGHAQFLGKLQS